MNRLMQIAAELSAFAEGYEDLLPQDTPELPAPTTETEFGTIRADGSTWTKDNSGKPMQLIYGYISERKDPAMFARMAALMGEDRLRNTLAQNGALARYKTHPNAVLFSGDPNALNLSYIVSNPLPQAGA